MADILVKINIKNVDCRNIYFVNNDNLFWRQRNNKSTYLLSRDFKLVLRITSINISGIRTQTKKTFSFSKQITFLQALREVSSKREDLLKKLKTCTHKNMHT